MNDSDQLRANVRAELARAGTTAAEMDRRLGWGQSTLSRRLLKAAEFRAHELTALARELRIPVARFFEGLDEQQPPDPDCVVPRARTG